MFPNRLNVELVKIISRDTIEMRVWERGSGETRACETGVAAMRNDLADRNVTIKLLGGDLLIEWAGDNHVYMIGPAAVAFQGEVAID